MLPAPPVSTAMPIPALTSAGLLPPFTGEATERAGYTPYRCTLPELVEDFGRTEERRRLLRGYLDFRDQFHRAGVLTGFQWLGGSFVEDALRRRGRAPADIDVTTFFPKLSTSSTQGLLRGVPEFNDADQLKKRFGLDHRIQALTTPPEDLVNDSAYLGNFFGHTREGARKGYLQIDLDPEWALDAEARHLLNPKP